MGAAGAQGGAPVRDRAASRGECPQAPFATTGFALRCSGVAGSFPAVAQARAELEAVGGAPLSELAQILYGEATHLTTWAAWKVRRVPARPPAWRPGPSSQQNLL